MLSYGKLVCCWPVFESLAKKPDCKQQKYPEPSYKEDRNVTVKYREVEQLKTPALIRTGCMDIYT